MPIELLIKVRPREPARPERFVEAVITIGRDPTSVVRFDMGEDREVSTRHAEIRCEVDAYIIADLESTNGTWVNGARLRGPRRLHVGDLVKLGRSGPELRVAAIDEQVWQPTMENAVHLPPIVATSGRGHRTQEFVARIVETRTRSLRVGVFVAFAAVLALGTAGWFYVSTRNDDGKVWNDVTAPAVRRANDDAVALIETEIPGQQCAAGCEGTGFSISPAGMIVTNRHVVLQRGAKASRIRVKFANSGAWHPAELVAIAADSATDLAIIQLTEPGRYPSVVGVSPDGPDLDAGSAILTIGFPLGTRLRMEGSGEAEVARTTVTTGSIGKMLTDIFQIDAAADHGSSGSPVFDRHGHAIGVISSGIEEESRRIVYVVPSSRIVELQRVASAARR
jgi:S1-C subfamily serine protease